MSENSAFQSVGDNFKKEEENRDSVKREIKPQSQNTAINQNNNKKETSQISTQQQIQKDQQSQNTQEQSSDWMQQDQNLQNQQTYSKYSKKTENSRKYTNSGTTSNQNYRERGDRRDRGDTRNPTNSHQTFHNQEQKPNKRQYCKDFQSRQGQKYDRRNEGDQNLVYRKNWRNEKNTQQTSDKNQKYQRNQNSRRDCEYKKNQNSNRYRNHKRGIEPSNQYRSHISQNSKKIQENGFKPDPSLITCSSQSINFKEIQIRLSFKKIMQEYHDVLVVPFQDEKLLIYPGCLINKKYNDLLKNRLEKKRREWQEKDSAVIDLNFCEIKTTNLREGFVRMLVLLGSFSDPNFKGSVLGIPFLGSDQNVEETSQRMIKIIFQECQKYRLKYKCVISIEVENGHHYIALKKYFYKQIEGVISSRKMQRNI